MIDSHAHITEERLLPESARIIAEMPEDGLRAMIEVGCDAATSEQAAALAADNARVFALVGTHPEFAADYGKREQELYASLSVQPKVVGIGEIGLDYFYETPPRDVQKRAFVAQIGLAHELGLPIALHIRDAYGDLLDILRANASCLSNGLLMHCYSGSAEFVRELARFDAYFAFGGAVTFKNAKKQDVIRAVPRDRLLVETDCPYMTPVPFRGKLNEPKYVRYTLAFVADVLGVDFAEAERLTERNTLELFPKMKDFFNGSICL